MNSTFYLHQTERCVYNCCFDKKNRRIADYFALLW